MSEKPDWLEIDTAYCNALEFSCTCGQDDANCAHCAQWEHARALLKEALSSQSEAVQPEPPQAYMDEAKSYFAQVIAPVDQIARRAWDMVYSHSAPEGKE